jgi:hypothetical protein
LQLIAAGLEMTLVPSQAALQAIVDSISEDGSARNEIVTRSGYSWSVVYEATLLLVKAKRIHIDRWRDAREPVYLAGAGINAKRPPPLTEAQRQAKFREKNKGLLVSRRRKKEQYYEATGHWSGLIPLQEVKKP